MKKYSVLMSIYSKEKPKYLKESIDSMINQTIAPDEIILVEDGPLTDELYNVIFEFNQKHEDIFTVIRNKKNIGLGLSLQRGLLKCRNELVVRMDTDDISKLDRCEKQLLMFAKIPNLSIVGGQISEFIDNKENMISKRLVPCNHKDIYEFSKKRCPLNHMSVMFKKSEVLKVGNYLDWYWNEDYYLWIRMLLNNCIFANCEDILVDVRVSNEMYQRRGGKKYFLSEFRLQKLMYENQIIGKYIYFSNTIKRFIIQILLPNKIRGIVFRKFARGD